jgi:nitrate reductase NapAB chaperone NapD
MPISGLVVSLHPDQESSRTSIQSLTEDPRIQVGPLVAGRVAIVAETDSVEEDKRLWQWLEDLPGVARVDLTFVGFDEEPSRPPAGS